MKKNLLTVGVFFILGIIQGHSQPIWTWVELNPMPMRIANNAVSHVTVGEEAYVCTFGGIDSTKTLEGISGMSMRMSVSTGEWEIIPDLPDTLGKIASGANTVGDIIYIIGGYHVLSGPPYEISSDRVHRYDAATNSYLPDGAPVPVPIDDQVQAVWRDSLIYVVTGWSQTQNVANVQIYNPALDQWSAGTPVPNNSLYKAFGASGTIIGDTIYYYGGAAGSSFAASGRLRKGVIDPNDPTQITWSELGNVDNFKGYRMAAVEVDNQAWWIGGSGITYNYDGIAYNGSGGVPPLTRIMGLSQSEPIPSWYINESQPYGVMDLRGAAKISENVVIICGGMIDAQEVTNKTYMLTYSAPSGIDNFNRNTIQLLSNLIQEGENLRLQTPFSEDMTFQVFDLKGNLLAQDILNAGDTDLKFSSMGNQSSGSYLLILGEGLVARFSIR
jgi:hypothetical protein